MTLLTKDTNKHFYLSFNSKIRGENMNQVQPIFILADDVKRTKGKDALFNNIEAAKQVAKAVQSTMGPKGMDKMIVNSLGDITVTNDGATILDEIEIEHPVAKMMVNIAKTQEKEIGDGTTTVVVLASELLSQAQSLLEQNIHPTLIVKGYQLANKEAIKVLKNLGEEFKVKDKEALKKIAETAMTGKGAEDMREYLSQLVVDAIYYVMHDDDVNIEDIKIEKKEGRNIQESELVKGIVIDKEKVHPQMPRKVENAKIALIDSPIEVKETEIDAKIQINSPDQIQSFLDKESQIIKEKVDKIIKAGANVIFCQKGIDEFAQYYLAKKGVFAIRRVRKSDIDKLAKATGAKIINNIDDIQENDLGFAQRVEEKRIEDEFMTFVEGCQNPKAVTILVRGGTEHVVDEIKRSLEDAIGDCISAIRGKKIVGGAGAVEIELSRAIHDYAQKLSGKLQLVAEAYAKSFEVIPKTLAQNAGLDSIDVLTTLKAEHERGNKWAGVNVEGGVLDSMKEFIIEPMELKVQAINSATEVSTLILRIDDILVSSPSKQEKEPQNPQEQ